MLLEWVYSREDLDANMWLSLLDVAYRTRDEKLEAVARQQFESKFDSSALKTESEFGSGSGRKVRRV